MGGGILLIIASLVTEQARPIIMEHTDTAHHKSYNPNSLPNTDTDNDFTLSTLSMQLFTSDNWIIFLSW